MTFMASFGGFTGKSKFNTLLFVVLVLAGAFGTFEGIFVRDGGASAGFWGCFLGCRLFAGLSGLSGLSDLSLDPDYHTKMKSETQAKYNFKKIKWKMALNRN